MHHLALAAALLAPLAQSDPGKATRDRMNAERAFERVVAIEDKQVDRAVERALAFLAVTQDRTDGAWRSRSTKSPAITSLAVMAFLSAGHVPGEGRYGAVVEKGIRRVLKFQQPSGVIAAEGGQAMYHHGISTLMLAEAAGVTDGALGDEVRAALTRAVAIILKSQRPSGEERGGWRYSVAPQGGSDISVTGWQIMALRAAKDLGCDVPPDAIERAVDFMRRCQKDGNGGFRYTPRDEVTVPCTGTAILALELCGKELHRSPEVLRAGAYLLRDENLPRWGTGHFFYGIYYGSQATFQLGGNYWAAYRPRMREALLGNQRPNGCWSGGDSDSTFGQPYCTAMAVLALTVEYRLLPIYQRGEESPDAGKAP
jgi:hypothetical protein